MSLLLEALKKAELAKQGRKPASDDDAGASGLSLQSEAQAAQARDDAQPWLQTVVKRGELPDISQPLEIFSEDLPSSSAKREEVRPAGAQTAEAPFSVEEAGPRPSPPEPPAARAPAGRPAAPAVEPEIEPMTRAAPAKEPTASPDRDAARQIFEAKEVEYNPKRNFHITIGVLLAAGAGYGGYVWWELQPKSAHVATSAPAPAAAQAPLAAAQPQPEPQAPPAMQPPVAAAPGTPAPAAGAHAAAVAPDEARSARTGPVFARRNRESAAADTANAAAPARSRVTEPGPARAEPGPERAERGPARAEASQINITQPALAVDPLVERGFESYQRGDLAGAREAYLQALKREPLNRDALLGLAAIDVHARSFDTAEARYVKLLELDPRDVHAQTGLMALRGQVDPVQTESRLKILIAANPDGAGLYFALGNQYAQQSRWAEAQAAYFKAYAGDTDNADYAYNLAVSLDHLRQKAPALQYYRRALALAANRPVSFEPSRIQTRIQELQRP